ncbi:Oxoglutarate/iron-dependent dioxygenase [Ostreococcus tauri]|uniref:Prolyl 3,4-dihydroxylase OGFOD1 n=1 Tax=Ostreococcus tauri TaxID=70448 RepID=OGFD1_OSTTA|nr:Oxoglutarate/iron-dependent dioxygenase [Ostreococcus tauri]Q01F03.1 RecName: Full=Prolyl 3,4-dihydroxylase OGFOD1; Short=otOGFOD1; AltName: Full=uS12 prolyl 3,4-dihydroxylase [Ostreococcus tauri]CAL52098.1 Oxoglutarate/iron-dependent dioxygenase [Ostreococcus tauri]|eukprot:XP_003074838.1 Oxoglutarate/iron-dependent dioxygenase [Ostreococcus tauri]
MPDHIYSHSFAQFLRNADNSVVNINPYPYVAFEDVFDDTFLRECLKELKSYLTAHFKETDLFKVFQTTDLANLEDCIRDAHTNVPNLIRLREHLYSPGFRGFVSTVTGTGPLDGAVDCSCNIYTSGCHLLCHDDVIGTRKISYIIYLSDPDCDWLAVDGGQLELYASDRRTVPTHTPVVSILPSWNSMVMFEVSPGRSFHAVREVSAEMKTRVSISGWFHTKERHIKRNQRETSTLDQLHSMIPATHAEWAVLHVNRVLSPSYSLVQDLTKWINPEYLRSESVKRVRQVFEADGSVQLFNFLLPHIAEPIKRKLNREDCRNSRHRCMYDHGYGDSWVVQGPPHVQRYLSYQPLECTLANKRSNSGELLKKLMCDLFESSSFQNWVRAVTGSVCDLAHSEVRRFRPGFDYTLAHAGTKRCSSEIDVTLCLTSGPNPAEWLSGDLGGFKCFIPIGSKSDRADVYEEIGEEQNMRSVTPSFNCLSLVKVNTGIGDFVKYVSTSAKSSRWDIVCRYST